MLKGEIIEWVDRDFYPPIVRVRFVDAGAREWFIVEKAPIVADDDFGPDSPLPFPVELPCDVIEEDGDHLVIVLPWRLEAEDGTTRFRVRRDQLTGR